MSTHTHIYQMDHTIIQIHIHIQESYINTYHKEQMDGERIKKKYTPIYHMDNTIMPIRINRWRKNNK